MSRRLLILSCLLLPCLPACWGMMSPVATQQDATLAADSAVAKNVVDARAAATAAPGDTQKAVAFSELLGAAYEGGTVTRGRLNGDTMVPEAILRLEEAASANPDDAGMLIAAQGNLLVRAGRQEEGMQKYEDSMAAQPNLVALIPLSVVYGQSRRHDELDAHCQATREVMTNLDDVYVLLAVCADARPGMAAADALPWANAEDVAFFEEQLAIETARREEERRIEAERQAEQERQWAAEQAQRDAAAAAAASNTGGGGGGSTHYSASISVSSRCGQTVKTFKGGVSNGNTQSGTHGSHSSNSSTSYHLSGSDQLCILTDGGDIISCIQPPDGSRYEITESCGGFMPK